MASNIGSNKRTDRNHFQATLRGQVESCLRQFTGNAVSLCFVGHLDVKEPNRVSLNSIAQNPGPSGDGDLKSA